VNERIMKALRAESKVIEDSDVKTHAEFFGLQQNNALKSGF
jgi:hypothetical protein